MAHAKIVKTTQDKQKITIKNAKKMSVPNLRLSKLTEHARDATIIRERKE